MDTQNNDNKLLTRIAQGDESAFRQLFDQYRDFICSFAFRLTGSNLITKDVVQEVFIKLWLNRQSLREVIHIKAYMYRLTRNHVLDGLKRKAHETPFFGRNDRYALSKQKDHTGWLKSIHLRSINRTCVNIKFCTHSIPLRTATFFRN